MQVYTDSRGYTWRLIENGTGCYRRDVDLPGGIGVVELSVDTIESFYDRDLPADWTPRRRFSLRGWKPRR